MSRPTSCSTSCQYQQIHDQASDTKAIASTAVRTDMCHDSSLLPSTPEPSEGHTYVSHEALKEENRDQSQLYQTWESKSTLLNWWWVEIASTISSFTCMAVIVYLLAWYHKKPLAEWNLPIGLNTLLNIFSTLARSTVLVTISACISQYKWIHYECSSHPLSALEIFDQASRGPLGSLKFLYVLPQIQAFIAAWGALITIAALAFGPFTQQALNTPTQRVSMGAQSASLSTAFDYMTNKADINHEFSVQQLVAGVFDGLYGRNTSEMLDCPTGNCEWSDFTSLGMCAECMDISEKANITCGGNIGDMWTKEACEFTFVNKFKSLTLTLDRMGEKGVGGYLLHSVPIALNKDKSFRSIADEFDAFNGFVAVKAPPPETPLRHSNISLCLFYPCIKIHHNVVVRNGTFYGGHIEEIRNETAMWAPAYGMISQDIVIRHPDIREGQPFSFGASAAFQSLGSEIFHTRLIKNWSDSVHKSQIGISTGNALYDSPSFQSIANAVAASLSTVIRSSNSTKVYGESFQDVTFIEFHWLWLLLPLAVVLSSILLLGISIFQSGNSSAPLWKSSSLALLAHRLRIDCGDDAYYHDREPHGIETADSIEELEERAKDVAVRLRKGVKRVNEFANE